MANHSNQSKEVSKNIDLTTLPDSAILRLPDVLRIYPVSKSHWWQGIKDGRYPKPVKLGVRARGWRISDVLALISDDK